jgi:hypothetical protein
MIRVMQFLLVHALTLLACVHAQNGGFDARPVFDGGGMKIQISLHGRIGYDYADRSPYQGWKWPGDGVSRLCGISYTSTPVVVGRIGDELHVTASHLRDNFIPGPIQNGKAAPDTDNPLYRAYTITWGETDNPDYREWPAALGAPVHADGSPLFYGRKQMFWVMNDLDTLSNLQHNGSMPMGLEMRCLLYEPWPMQENMPVASGAARENTLILQITYINKGSRSIQDAYFGYFMDMDVREAGHNHAGSDSSLAMVYTYMPSTYRGPAIEGGMPAAFALQMLQTPIEAAPGASARWFEGWKRDTRNIPVSAGIAPLKTSPLGIAEPRVRDERERWAALLRGHGKDDLYVLNPLTGAPSTFWFSGDHVAKTGWVPELGLPLSTGIHLEGWVRDVRVLISAGPVDMAPGDTQQVSFAFIATQGATAEAALHELRDRAVFTKAEFMQHRLATAYRASQVLAEGTGAAPARIDLRARYAHHPAELSVEVSDARGRVLLTAPLERRALGSDWLYEQSVTLPETRREGVNVSFIATDGNDAVRIPGRVSIPAGGSIDFDGILMLEEGDDNGRVAPDENAKWFPRFVNNTPYDYNILAQSHFLPEQQWLQVPELPAGSVFPSAERPWIPSTQRPRSDGSGSMGYNTLWQASLIDSSGSMQYAYDLYDPDWNVWWERVNEIPTDLEAGEWYDVLMTQVSGISDERPGVRIVDMSALRDKWYVATIGGTHLSRRLALHDSASGAPYFTDFALDGFIFAGSAPVTDGFRVVRGTITDHYTNGNTVTGHDRFIFNPRHVLIGRSRLPATSVDISPPSPSPLTEWTSLRVEIPADGMLRAAVYDALGRRVSILRDEYLAAGRHLLIWNGHWSDGRPADSGMYLIRIGTPVGEFTRKIMVLR